MRLIGIDPGISGAIVIMSEQFQLIEWMLMPTLKAGSSSRVNGAALANFIREFSTFDSVVRLERVGAAPTKGRRQGGASMFTFGHATGVADGVISALGLPITLVNPPTWKKKAGLIGTDKDASRSRAIQLWPNWRDLDAKGKGQAFADAALIARFGG